MHVMPGIYELEVWPFKFVGVHEEPTIGGVHELLGSGQVIAAAHRPKGVSGNASNALLGSS